jgi:putative peptidoglycan lipid II flippase
MHEAAYLLAGFALASQLLALVRDRLLASEFGATHTLDIYYAAFRVPDFLFATVASLLSLYALLPVLSRLQERDGGFAISFLRRSLLAFFAGMGALALVLFILTPFLIPFIAPGLAGDEAARAELIFLTRILLLQPILLGASNILAAFTQLKNRFFLYAVSPLLYNLGIIAGILFFYPQIGMAGLGWGVVLGALLHMLLQLPFFLKEKTKNLPNGEFSPALLEVLKLSVPRTLALASGQLSLLALHSFRHGQSPSSCLRGICSRCRLPSSVFHIRSPHSRRLRDFMRAGIARSLSGISKRLSATCCSGRYRLLSLSSSCVLSLSA